jgi:hemoglobin-like flavoprotein
MGINAFSVNVPVRESRNTYVPLPFEEMYSAMQQKQEMYNRADQYEREQKKQISALTSAISAHKTYLDDYKNRYLQDAITLHNSMPDKGSAEYIRKLQDMVDSYASDPNFNIIQRSNAAWQERVKTVTKQMADGKYSKAADIPYLTFTGENPDGTLKEFVYAGNRERKDWQKLTADTIEKVPLQESSKDVTDKETGRHVKIATKVKSAGAIKQSLATVLGMDREALQDMQVELGITDPKQFEKHLDALAKTNAKYDVDEVYGWDSGLVKRQDENIQKQKEEAEKAAQIAYNMGTYQDAGHKAILDKLSSYVDSEGNIKDSYLSGIAGLPLLLGPGSLIDPGSKEERIKSSKKEILAIPEIKNVYENFKTQNMSDDDALRAAIKFYRQRGDSQEYQTRPIIDKEERTAVEGLIAGNLGMLDFYDAQNPDFAQPMTLAQNKNSFIKDGKIMEINVGGELAPSRFGNKAYTVTIGGKQYIAALNSQNPKDMQSKLLFEMQRNPAPTKLSYFMPDPSHPELGNIPRENVIVVMGPDGKLRLQDDPNP